MYVGMRTIKTGIAVGITMLLGQLFGLERPFFAIIAAIISIQATISDSITTGRNRIIGTIIGTLTGILFALLAPKNPFLAGIGVMVTIHICNLLRVQNSIFIATVVFSSIVVEVMQVFDYALFRFMDTLLGVVVAFMVNYLIYPPNPEREYSKRIGIIHESLFELLHAYLKNYGNLKGKGDLDNEYSEINRLLVESEELHNLLLKENKFALLKAASPNKKFALERVQEVYHRLLMLRYLGQTDSQHLFNLHQELGQITQGITEAKRPITDVIQISATSIMQVRHKMQEYKGDFDNSQDRLIYETLLDVTEGIFEYEEAFSGANCPEKALRSTT